MIKDLLLALKIPDSLPPHLHLRCLDEVEIRNTESNINTIFSIVRMAYVWVENCTFARNTNVLLSGGADSVSIYQSSHVYFKNVTALFSVDGLCDVNDSSDIHFENVVCGWALHNSTHIKGSHSTGMNIYNVNGFFCINCLLANANERQPQVVSSRATFSCLTVYNPGTLYGGRITSDYGASSADFRNVVLIPGPDSKPDTVNLLSLDETAKVGNNQVWVDDPLLVRRGDRDELSSKPVNPPLPCTRLPLEQLGARNRFTDLLVNGVRNRTGRIEDVPMG